MSEINELLEQLPEFPIQPANRAETFGLTHVPFTGVPYRHRDSGQKMVLAVDINSGSAQFLEFFIDDVDRVERVETMVADGGKALPVVRLWVKKGAVAFRYTPFVVADNRQVFKKMLPAAEDRQD